jgi:hypothetical protein
MVNLLFFLVGILIGIVISSAFTTAFGRNEQRQTVTSITKKLKDSIMPPKGFIYLPPIDDDQVILQKTKELRKKNNENTTETD